METVVDTRSVAKSIVVSGQALVNVKVLRNRSVKNDKKAVDVRISDALLKVHRMVTTQQRLREKLEQKQNGTKFESNSFLLFGQ